MPSRRLKQKITGPRLTLLGKTYPSKIIGLHNRFRAKTDKRLIYQDIRKHPGKIHQGVFGIYVPTQDKHIIYLRRGAKDITVAHELMHGILYEEGYVATRCRMADLKTEPRIGILAHKIQDVVIHPVLFQQLRRSGFDVDQEEKYRSVSLIEALQKRAAEPSDPYAPAYILSLFSDAISYVESYFRYPFAREQLQRIYRERFPATLQLGEEIVQLISWIPDRTPLKYRVLMTRLIYHLDQVAEAHHVPLSLPTRILLPPFLVKSRLADPTREFFSLKRAETWESKDSGQYLLALQFLPDKSYSQVWSFQHVDQQKQAAEQLQKQLDGMEIGDFLKFNYLEYLLIEKKSRRRCLVKRITFGSAGRPSMAST